jgi:transformation/transcription domain-associated protein
MDLQIKESKWLIKCFLNYLRHDKNEVNVLFDILTIFLFHSRIDYTFLKEFYIIEVLHNWICIFCLDQTSFLYFIIHI